MGYYFLFFICYGYDFVNDAVDWLFNFYVHVFDYFNLNYSLLDDWYLDLSLDLLYYNFFDNLLYYLRNFNYLFNHSWHHNNFLNNFLNFNNCGHFNHFFNNFSYYNLHRFDDFLSDNNVGSDDLVTLFTL